MDADAGNDWRRKNEKKERQKLAMRLREILKAEKKNIFAANICRCPTRPQTGKYHYTDVCACA